MPIIYIIYIYIYILRHDLSYLSEILSNSTVSMVVSKIFGMFTQKIEEMIPNIASIICADGGKKNELSSVS